MIFIVLLVGIGTVINSRKDKTAQPVLSQYPTAILIQSGREKVFDEASTTPTKYVEKANIVVSSVIVKKINGKYRYFFDIRNKDTKPFKGNVTILLYNTLQKSSLAGDTFATEGEIEPELGASVYIDAFTGPPGEHGENGISKFEYTARDGDNVLNEGKGEITDKFEGTDGIMKAEGY